MRKSRNYSREDLARFSDNTRLPEIGEYLSEKLFEVMVHNDRKQGLMYDISKLQGQKLQIERNREEIENCHKVIQQLDSYGLDMTDFWGFAKVIQSMKELGFETLKIASDVNEAANFKREKDRKLAELKETNRQFDHTRRWYQSPQIAVNSHLQRLSIYNEFEWLGIDARKLKVLFDTIMDVLIANGVKFSVAFDKFIEDVRKNMSFF
jgi:hypothetical protein